EEIRVWVPACATGEEAYSLAILIMEQLGRSDVRPQVRVFAGDIDEDGLADARTGRYSEGITDHVSPERLERFFTKHDSVYQVRKEVREMCVFSTHNLLRPPPFSRIALVSCRNFLIYLEPPLQNRVLSMFHYALRPEGYMFLGSSESLGHA